MKRLPKHIGVIPDGNRRWAQAKGFEKQDGYKNGIAPGFELYKHCLELGIPELTFYGFTQDNNKRPAVQRQAFVEACIDSVMQLASCDANLLVVGNSESPMFPQELLPFCKERVKFGAGKINVNFLVNYGWAWDLSSAPQMLKREDIYKSIASGGISRIDLVIRWGGRCRLSGFLPVQTVYSDFYTLDDLWPDYKKEHLYKALEWYDAQDVTLGG